MAARYACGQPQEFQFQCVVKTNTASIKFLVSLHGGYQYRNDCNFVETQKNTQKQKNNCYNLRGVSTKM